MRTISITLLGMFIYTSATSQWSRNNQTVRLTNLDDKVWIANPAPLGGGTHRLFVESDPNNYGDLLVRFRSEASMASNESVLELSTLAGSNNNSRLLTGQMGTNDVFDFFSTGKLNLLNANNNFNRALDVRGDEAIWYNSDYFSWGFGGNWNRMADPVTIGGAEQPANGVGLLITDSDDIRLKGSGTRNIDFYQSTTKKGSVGYFGNTLYLNNTDVTGTVTLQMNGIDRFKIFEAGGFTQLFGDLHISGGVYGISDQRTKRNVQPITKALATILSLQGKKFEFKSDQFTALTLPTGQQYGLIAQEVEVVIPDLVDTHTTTEFEGEKIDLKGIDHQALIPILIEAIKEQNELIQSLEKRLSAVEMANGQK